MVNHSTDSPFPFKRKDGQTITDELCYCGHRRSEHHDTIAFGHDKMGWTGEMVAGGHNKGYVFVFTGKRMQS